MWSHIFREKVNITDKDDQEKSKKMQEQIDAIGGVLTFTMKVDENGWAADCKEFPAIITGGENPNPSEDEIMKNLIEAVKTAFDVPIGKIEKLKSAEPNKIPKIKLEREFQLV